MPSEIYLDYNATAPMSNVVQTAMAAALETCGNPSSVHRFGRAQRARIEDARRQVALLVGADARHVVFTSGGTEANNLALNGIFATSVIVSAIEHDSILHGVDDALIAPVGRSGVIDLEKLEALVREAKPPVLVSLMLANNETGIVQPVAEAAAITHAHGGILHCDAVQAAGRLAIDMVSLGADMMTLSAHKIGGPLGIGALVIDEQVNLRAQVRGGGQERGYRAGTENVAGIVGFGAAADHGRACHSDWQGVSCLRERLEARISDEFGDDIQIIGRDVVRIPNTCCVARVGIASELQVIALDLAGIAVSAGSACSSGKVQSSHVLAAMGIAEPTARTAIRVSLGPTTSDADIDHFFVAYRSLKKPGVAHAA